MIEDAENNDIIRNQMKAVFYKVSGFCTFFPNDEEKSLFYLACPKCKKKCNNIPEGYNCEICGYFSEAIPTYNFGFMFNDFS